MASVAEQMASNISLAGFSKATELKKRIWFTLGALVLFRFLSFVPMPGIDPRAMASMFRRPFELRSTIYQFESLGVKSVSIAALTAIFVGMVMAVQFAFGLQRFGGMEYTGRIVGVSFSRELAPTLLSTGR